MHQQVPDLLPGGGLITHAASAIDHWVDESELDLNKGTPDRLGMRVFEIWFGAFGIYMKSNPTTNLRPVRESLVLGGLRLGFYNYGTTLCTRANLRQSFFLSLSLSLSLLSLSQALTPACLRASWTYA